MTQLSHRFLVFVSCIALIALLNGCVSSVNEDYAVTGPKQEFALGSRPITQSFVAGERNLDAIQVMMRLKSSTHNPGPARLGFSLVDARTRAAVYHSVKTVALTGQPQPVRFAFPVRALSGGHAYEFALTDSRVRRKTNKPLLVLTSDRDPYPKGRAGGRVALGAGHDLNFRTEVAISAGNAIHSFAGRLLADKPFLIFYGILLSALILPVVVGWPKRAHESTTPS